MKGSLSIQHENKSDSISIRLRLDAGKRIVMSMNASSFAKFISGKSDEDCDISLRNVSIGSEKFRFSLSFDDAVCNCPCDASCDCNDHPSLSLRLQGNKGYGMAFWTQIDDEESIKFGYWCKMLGFEFFASDETAIVDELKRRLAWLGDRFEITTY